MWPCHRKDWGVKSLTKWSEGPLGRNVTLRVPVTQESPRDFRLRPTPKPTNQLPYKNSFLMNSFLLPSSSSDSCLHWTRLPLKIETSFKTSELMWWNSVPQTEKHRAQPTNNRQSRPFFLPDWRSYSNNRSVSFKIPLSVDTRMLSVVDPVPHGWTFPLHRKLVIVGDIICTGQRSGKMIQKMSKIFIHYRMSIHICVCILRNI